VVSLSWIGLCSLVVEPAGGQPTSHTDAALALVLSLGALVVGVHAARGPRRPEGAGTRPRAPASLAAGAG